MAGDENSRVAAIRTRTQAEITHPERVLFPPAGLTRLDVIEYYLGVAPFLLPYLHSRPLTLHRFPGSVGICEFFEKDAPAWSRGRSTALTAPSGAAGSPPNMGGGTAP